MQNSILMLQFAGFGIATLNRAVTISYNKLLYAPAAFYLLKYTLGANNMSIQDIINIVFATVVFIIIFLISGFLTMYYLKRNGKMKIKTRISFSSGEMIHELRSRYKYWGLGTLKSLDSIDKYIIEKKEKYSADTLLNDEEFIFKLSSFTGEVLKTKKHYRWVFTDNEPYMVKRDSIIMPFDKVRKNIKNGDVDSIYSYGSML